MKVKIYGTQLCPNCKTAETLTIKSNLNYEMLKEGSDFTIPDLISKIGLRVSEFPQIFVDDIYIGGISAYREYLKLNIKENNKDDDLSDFEL